MSTTRITVNRTLVGVLAFICLVSAAAIWAGDLGRSSKVWQAAFTRVGLVLAALWIALPPSGKMSTWGKVSPWTLAGIVLAIVLVARARVPIKALIPAVIVLSIGARVLRPKDRRGDLR